MSDEKKENPIQLPQEYEKPEIHSEDLMAFAATCNGTTTASRKSNTADGCKADRLNS